VSVRRKKLFIGRLALVGVIALASASPAFAQSAGVGGNIGTFIQMDPGQLILLRAGMPPVRGRKIQYWREKAFKDRVASPPTVAAHPAIATGASISALPPIAAGAPCQDDLGLELVAPALEAAGFEALPAEGATDAEVEGWMERFIDASAIRQEVDHAR